MQQVLSFVALGGFGGGRMAGRRIVGARMERVRTIQLMSVIRVLNKPNGYRGYCVVWMIPKQEAMESLVRRGWRYASRLKEGNV